MNSSSIVAIVPMKSFTASKSRLSSDLTASQRMALSNNLLRRVLRAIINPLPTAPGESAVDSAWVVGGDQDIKKVALEEGASWLEEEGSDINETLWLTFQRAFSSGKAALFLPGDLPFIKPRDIQGLVRASGRLKNVTLAPAVQGGGTNSILVVPDLPAPFRPLLGPDSFRRHLAQATESGVSIAIYYSPGLAFDLDTFQDLQAYEHMEPGLREKLIGGAGN